MRYYHQKRKKLGYDFIYFNGDRVVMSVLDERVTRMAIACSAVFPVGVLFVKGTNEKILFSKSEIIDEDLEYVTNIAPNLSSWIGRDIIAVLKENGGRVRTEHGLYAYRSYGRYTYKGLALKYDTAGQISGVADALGNIISPAD